MLIGFWVTALQSEGEGEEEEEEEDEQNSLS